MQVEKLLEHYHCSFINQKHNKPSTQVDKLLQNCHCSFISQKQITTALSL